MESPFSAGRAAPSCCRVRVELQDGCGLIRIIEWERAHGFERFLPFSDQAANVVFLRLRESSAVPAENCLNLGLHFRLDFGRKLFTGLLQGRGRRGRWDRQQFAGKAGGRSRSDCSATRKIAARNSGGLVPSLGHDLKASHSNCKAMHCGASSCTWFCASLLNALRDVNARVNLDARLVIWACEFHRRGSFRIPPRRDRIWVRRQAESSAAGCGEVVEFSKLLHSWPWRDSIENKTKSKRRNHHEASDIESV